MIVKMSGLEADYKSFFDSFEKDFKDLGITEINDLTTFYSALSMVKADLAERQYWKYLRIPLGEEYFKIDADARSISIPKHFSKNGLGVEGDHTAEVVFFEIDRYFDAMDLAACMGTMDQPADEGSGCFIQWKNAAGHEGVSKAYAFDIYDEKIDGDGNVVEDAKLIFGWIISDNITEEDGNIEFSVRFVQTRVDETENGAITNIIYSFSTLSASCPVKATLRLDLMNIPKDMIEDLSDLVLNRPIYSGVANSSDGSKPVLMVDLGDGGDLTVEDEETGKFYLILSVEALPAKTDDTVSFMWYKNGVAQTEEMSGEPQYNEDGSLKSYKSEFRVDTAGSYYAYIANNHTSTAGIPLQRWIQTNSFLVTEPQKIDIVFWQDYATSVEGTVLTLDTHTEDTTSKITYKWEEKTYTRDTETAPEYQVIEGIEGNSYTVPVDFNGEVRVTAFNTLNNSYEEVVSPACVIRESLDGKEPFTVNIIEEDGVLKLDLGIAEGYDNHFYKDEEIICNWDIYGQGLVRESPNGPEVNAFSIVPAVSGIYSCRVRQRIPAPYGGPDGTFTVWQYSDDHITVEVPEQA